MKQTPRVVVIGNGMAGARFVEELVRRRGEVQPDVVMFGDEPYGNYNRILLSGVLAGTHQPEDVFLNPLAWYHEHDVTLHAGARVTRIDREARRVYAGGDLSVPYDQLIIATGSVPFIPPIDGLRGPSGALADGAFVFRTLDDCHEIVRHAKQSRRAAVIGGGLLGLEAARGLLELGLDVHVVHLMPHLMDVQLDRPAGRVLELALTQMGVHLHLEKATSGVLGDGRVAGLRFSDGSTLDCDLVVVAAGIRPNVALAAQAGLDVGRGVIVGDDLATSDPHVFAIGECSEHRGQTYGLVAPLWEQARVLAERLAGVSPDATYEGSRVSTKLKVMEVDLAVMGVKEADPDLDEVVTYAEPSRGLYKKLIVRDGRLAGAIVMGDGTIVPTLLQAFDRGTTLPDDRSQLLFPRTAGDGQAPSVQSIAAATQVCNCNGVTKQQLVDAVRNGCRTLKAVCSATRAATGCGSCATLVQAVVEDAAGGSLDVDPAAHYYVPGVPMAKTELVAAIREHELRSVSAVFTALAGGREDAGSKPGLASLLKSMWGAAYEDERDARYINDRVHANIQKDRTFSVVPRIYGGVTSAAELRRIADVADKYQVPMVKITGGQRIDLLGIRKEQLPHVWKDLGMPSGHAYTKGFRTCKTCVGTEFCRYGVGDSTGLGVAIERRFQGIEAPAKLKLATAGCPRNCSEATTKDIGAVAIEGGRWEIYVGGAAGSRVRKGDLLVTVDTHDEVMRLTGRFMQYYREHGRYLERTYDFVERLGLDHVRAVVVDDAEGIAADLDRAMQESVDAYVDPWLEADTPVHPAQFVDVVGAGAGPAPIATTMEAVR
ncbi:MAG TPA: nitrite reductase large subunit NirB [Luteitalea sp.]|nr:nitrite reductase large subunit NirB [Luteitalea sp.]